MGCMKSLWGRGKQRKEVEWCSEEEDIAYICMIEDILYMYKNAKLEGHQVWFVSSLWHLHRSHDQMSVTDTSIGRTDALTVFLPLSFLFYLFSYSICLTHVHIWFIFIFLCPLFPLANHFPIYMLARLPLCSLLSHSQLSNEFLLFFVCVWPLPVSALLIELVLSKCASLVFLDFFFPFRYFSLVLFFWLMTIQRMNSSLIVKYWSWDFAWSPLRPLCFQFLVLVIT